MPLSCPEPRAARTARKPRRKRGPYQRHALHTVKREVTSLDDGEVAAALREWKSALVLDLGGEDAISTQQRALIDLACRSKLLVDAVDAYILAMPSPVNKQRRRLFDVVKERSTLVGQLQSILRDLGLARRTKDLDLGAELARLARGAEDRQSPAEDRHEDRQR